MIEKKLRHRIIKSALSDRKHLSVDYPSNWNFNKEVSEISCGLMLTKCNRFRVRAKNNFNKRKQFPRKVITEKNWQL